MSTVKHYSEINASVIIFLQDNIYNTIKVTILYYEYYWYSEYI